MGVGFSMVSRSFYRAVDYILDHPRALLGMALATLVVVAALTFSIVSLLHEHGVRGVPLRIQDAVIDGTLSSAVVWLVFRLMRERRRLVQEKVRAAADLHEQLQDVLYAVVQIKDEASDEDIADFLHTLDKTAETLRQLVRSPVGR